MSDSTTGPVWDDEEYPWVNAEVNSNSKVGVAARCVVMWGTDVHAEGKDPATYESALNAIWDLADTITELIAERDALRQELAQRQDAPPCVEMTEARVAALEWLFRLGAFPAKHPNAIVLRQLLAEIGGQGDDE